MLFPGIPVSFVQFEFPGSQTVIFVWVKHVCFGAWVGKMNYEYEELSKI